PDHGGPRLSLYLAHSKPLSARHPGADRALEGPEGLRRELDDPAGGDPALHRRRPLARARPARRAETFRLDRPQRPGAFSWLAPAIREAARRARRERDRTNPCDGSRAAICPAGDPIPR